MLRRRALVSTALAVLAAPGARAAPSLRVGVLRFGSFSWELDVIRRHGFASMAGIALATHEYAGSPAAQVALQAGEVDMIVQDWLWVSRQRTSGADWSFVPFSNALGALVVPGTSKILSLPDLAGRQLGVAGSPLDKSWIILRAYAERHDKFDLARETRPSFGAPALLAQELDSGRLDAMLTFWPFAARAEAAGMRRVLNMAAAVAGLGIPPGAPFVGYVFSARWAAENKALLDGFLAAAARAQALLENSDDEWRALAPLTRAKTPAELTLLRDYYRAGIPHAWGKSEEDAAAALYDVLAATGGVALVGPAKSVAPGTFWPTGLS